MIVSDIVILLIVAGLVSAAVWKIRRDKKRGNPCSGCSCSSAGACHLKLPENLQ